MKGIIFIVVGLALSGGALAQSQNIAKTGAGNSFDNLEVLQAEIKKFSDSQFVRALKGAAGLAGIAAALSVASDAVNFQIKADGSVLPGGSSGGSAGTSTVISSSTSTN